ECANFCFGAPVGNIKLARLLFVSFGKRSKNNPTIIVIMKSWSSKRPYAVPRAKIRYGKLMVTKQANSSFTDRFICALPQLNGIA
ncbi:MAG: hypothetical protein QXU67_04655, partial [Candidatus Bathyarchaeia archaeon]